MGMYVHTHLHTRTHTYTHVCVDVHKCKRHMYLCMLTYACTYTEFKKIYKNRVIIGGKEGTLSQEQEDATRGQISFLWSLSFPSCGRKLEGSVRR